MAPETLALFDAVLALAEDERLLLVERLLETLPPEPNEVNDDELLAELERRSADFEQGKAEAIPWSELRKQD
ncbi:MAG TPA: addiction module protein [Gemmataceae bacterium]|nr:addiction module protein [Gemmataceae bacterium]